ncbi:uncharacterized protein [Bos taurus]|uniref:uncharacterized protein n=1 Tax=Bos taurus TaxID=9913 RepID=UPI0028CB38A2|nr:uncharacterized protein LOC107131330 [Bos taurus]
MWAVEEGLYLGNWVPQVGAFQAASWWGSLGWLKTCPSLLSPGSAVGGAGPGCAPARTQGWKLLLLCSEQKELEKQLENVLTCDQKEWATSPCQAFLKIFQLLKGTIDSVQDIGPPITSRVQAMVLNTFSEFLKRYRAEGTAHFLQQQAGAGPSPQLHVLQNCCVLRKVWQDLGQAHTPLADLVLSTISAIEDQSQDDLVSRVRSLCQSLLRHHFGREDKELAHTLRSLRRGLERYAGLLPPPTNKSLVQSLYKAVFTEYLQALVTHLKRLKPRKWEDHRGQVETDVRELREAFGRQEGLGDGAPGLEAFVEVFQLSGEQGSACLDEWLASFRDRFPDYVRRESKAREGQGLAQGPPQAGAGPSLVSPPPDAEIHPAGPSERPSPDPFLVSRAPRTQGQPEEPELRSCCPCYWGFLTTFTR